EYTVGVHHGHAFIACIIDGNKNDRTNDAYEKQGRKDGGQDKGLFAYAAEVLALDNEPGLVHKSSLSILVLELAGGGSAFYQLDEDLVQGRQDLLERHEGGAAVEEIAQHVIGAVTLADPDQ